MATDLCPLRFRRDDPCVGRVEFRDSPPRYVCDRCGRIFDPETVQRLADKRAS